MNNNAVDIKKPLYEIILESFAVYYTLISIFSVCETPRCSNIVSIHKTFIEEYSSNIFRAQQVLDNRIVWSPVITASGTSIYPGTIVSGTVNY